MRISIQFQYSQFNKYKARNIISNKIKEKIKLPFFLIAELKKYCEQEKMNKIMEWNLRKYPKIKKKRRESKPKLSNEKILEYQKMIAIKAC